MKNIIVYSTKYGATEIAANSLKDILKDETISVNIKKQKVNELDSFDNVILGGSIYIGKIQKELINFIKKNIDIILMKKLGLFICSGAHGSDAEDQQFIDVFPEEINNKAIIKKNLGNIVDFNKMSFLDGFALKVVKKINQNYYIISEDRIKEVANIFNK